MSVEIGGDYLAGGERTHVLSFACFKLSRNFKPAVVVDSTVSEVALVSACTQAPRCQHCPRTDIQPCFLERPRMHRRRACGVGAARRGRRRWWPAHRAPQVSRALVLGAIPHRGQHASLHLQNTPRRCITHPPMDCTYRPFLSLRRAIVLLGRSGARGFALGRALHFHHFRNRVVCPSEFQRVSRRRRIVAAVQ